MVLTKERKKELIDEHKRGGEDTGSPEVQISILTTRINDLTDHMRLHKKRLRHPAWPFDDGQSTPTAAGLP